MPGSVGCRDIRLPELLVPSSYRATRAQTETGRRPESAECARLPARAHGYRQSPALQNHHARVLPAARVGLAAAAVKTPASADGRPGLIKGRVVLRTGVGAGLPPGL